MNGRPYNYDGGFGGNHNYNLGPMFQRYLRELQTLPTEEEDAEDVQRATYESIINAARERQLASERGSKDDEHLARALQEEEDQLTASYIGNRDNSSYNYEKAKNNRESKQITQPLGEEGYIFGSGPDGLNFGNISPNRDLTRNVTSHRTTHTSSSINTTTTTTTTVPSGTAHRTTTTTTTTAPNSANRRDRPPRTWGTTNTLDLTPDNPFGASRAPPLNTSLFSTNYLSNRANLPNFMTPTLPTFPPATSPPPNQPRRGPAYLQQDLPQNNAVNVSVAEALANPSSRHSYTAGLPLVNSPPRLSQSQRNTHSANNTESVGLTDEEYALMLQREETLNFRRMLGEELASSLTDEDILSVPAHAHPLYMPNAHDESGDEYYSDSDDEGVNLDDMTYEELLALGDRIGTVSKGASKAQISQCPERRYEGERTTKEKSCSICQEEFEPGIMLRFLPCLHCYHTLCIDQWLSVQSKCPVCQHSIKDA